MRDHTNGDDNWAHYSGVTQTSLLHRHLSTRRLLPNTPKWRFLDVSPYPRPFLPFIGVFTMSIDARSTLGFTNLTLTFQLLCPVVSSVSLCPDVMLPSDWRFAEL